MEAVAVISSLLVLIYGISYEAHSIRMSQSRYKRNDEFA